MRPFTVVDADSHVEEPPEAWEFLDPIYQARKPFIMTCENRPGLQDMNSFWYVDGQLTPKPLGRGVTSTGTPVTMERARVKSFPPGSQTLTDPDARLRDMDEAGVDIQVIFPSIFLAPVTQDAGFEAALMRSYNTYMATQCGQRADRLKWAAVLPVHNVAEAVAEVRRARELGAVAVVTTHATLGTYLLNDPTLDPLWAEVERVGLPLGVHCGWSHPGITESFDTNFGAHVLGFTLPVFMAFYAFTGGGILDRFPRLRLAFLEAGCEWVPYLVQRMDHYFESESRKGGVLPQRRASEYLRECQIYLTTEAEEQHLPRVLEFVGDDRIMVSVDMPHGEARENSVAEIEQRDDLTAAQKRQLLSDNALRFYDLRQGA